MDECFGFVQVGGRCFHSYWKLPQHKVMLLHNSSAFKFALCQSKSASCWRE
jgi:hypothetical protein